jgi:hypothetical protein
MSELPTLGFSKNKTQSLALERFQIFILKTQNQKPNISIQNERPNLLKQNQNARYLFIRTEWRSSRRKDLR